MAESIVDNVPCVEDRVRFFQQVAQDVVPDFKRQPELPTMLFASDWDQDNTASSQDFTREILQALKAAHPIQFDRLLASCTLGQRDLLRRFIDGADLDDIFEKFDFDSTRGSRQEFGLLKDSKIKKLALGEAADPPQQGGIIPRLRNAISNLNCFGPRRTDVGLYEDVGKKKPLLVGWNTK